MKIHTKKNQTRSHLIIFYIIYEKFYILNKISWWIIVATATVATNKIQRKFNLTLCLVYVSIRMKINYKFTILSFLNKITYIAFFNWIWIN